MDRSADGATGGVRWGAALLLFSLCYWVPAGRATAALLLFAFRCLSQAWRFVTFRRANSVGPWPLLPAVLVGAALEKWAWQATAGAVALQHHRTDLELLRARVPLEEAGCWPLLALRRCLQLAVIQLSGQPAAAVLGSPPFPVPFVVRLMKCDQELAHMDSESWRAIVAKVERDPRLNTVHLVFGGFFLCGVIVVQLLACAGLLLVALLTRVGEAAIWLWSSACTTAAARPAGAAVAPSQDRKSVV